MRNNIATIMVWNEVMVHRGSTEMGSALLLYATENFNLLDPSEDRKLVFCSDICVFQNNNWKVITSSTLTTRKIVHSNRAKVFDKRTQLFAV